MTATLSLANPWVTHTVEGRKPIETRTAPPAGDSCPAGLRPLPGLRLNRGDRLLIHASKTIDSLKKAPTAWQGITPGTLAPGGHIVASCTFVDAIPILRAGLDVYPALSVVVSDEVLYIWHEARHASQDISDQRHIGVYAPGRWAWLLEDVKATTDRCPACDGWATVDTEWCSFCDRTGGCPPIPASGSLGLWSWPPKEV